MNDKKDRKTIDFSRFNGLDWDRMSTPKKIIACVAVGGILLFGADATVKNNSATPFAASNQPTNQSGEISKTQIDSKDNNQNNSNNSNNDTSNVDSGYSLDKPFTFDDLEITLGSKLTTTKLKNQFSEHDGETVISMPIKVKNLDDESKSLNMFYLKIYGSKGTQLDSVSSYFSDEGNVEWAGELRSGASYDKYLHFLYDGDGTYAIEFDDWAEKITIEFDVSL